MTPKRIQRRRSKGYKTPPNTVYCGRPGPWGNPLGVNYAIGRTIDNVMYFYRRYLARIIASYIPNADPQYRGLNIEDLRGKHLSCWCKLCEKHKNGKPLDEACDDCQPCHVDVIGEFLYGKDNP